MLGIYIHVPFCLRKCPYCDFYSEIFSGELAEKYVGAVIRNISSYNGMGLSADTIYFGGGTPSLLTPNQVDRILSRCADAFAMHDPEITLECNPSSVDLQKLREYRSAGANRLSFGVQSSNDKQLEWLGRLHDFKGARQAVENAASAGFDNISCDLMLGLAGQSEESLKKEISDLSWLPVSHISAYMLKIEEGTAFDCSRVREASADEELMCRLYLAALSELERYGFAQYEISNFAKPGRESRHNLKYWQGEEYLGIGPSAHSYLNGSRFFCPEDTKDFISADIQSRETEDEASDRVEEYIMLGLRLAKGISFQKAEGLGCPPERINHMKYLAEQWQLHGLCKYDGENMRLTPQGFLLSGEIIAQLLS